MELSCEFDCGEISVNIEEIERIKMICELNIIRANIKQNGECVIYNYLDTRSQISKEYLLGTLMINGKYFEYPSQCFVRMDLDYIVRYKKMNFGDSILMESKNDKSEVRKARILFIDATNTNAKARIGFIDDLTHCALALDENDWDIVTIFKESNTDNNNNNNNSNSNNRNREKRNKNGWKQGKGLSYIDVEDANDIWKQNDSHWYKAYETIKSVETKIAGMNLKDDCIEVKLKNGASYLYFDMKSKLFILTGKNGGNNVYNNGNGWIYHREFLQLLYSINS